MQKSGRSAGLRRGIKLCKKLEIPNLELASLREDYLNQVQRDFLSQHIAALTPLADAFLRMRTDCKP